VRLYGRGHYFLCRHGYHLARVSQSENTSDRALRRANKIRQRLGGECGMFAPFPPKPKGMWLRTYERLQEEVCDAKMRADEAFAIRAERLVTRVSNSKRTRRQAQGERGIRTTFITPHLRKAAWYKMLRIRKEEPIGPDAVMAGLRALKR